MRGTGLVSISFSDENHTTGPRTCIGSNTSHRQPYQHRRCLRRLHRRCSPQTATQQTHHLRSLHGRTGKGPPHSRTPPAHLFTSHPTLQVCLAVATRAAEVGAGGTIPLQGSDYLNMDRQWHDRSPYVNQALFNPEWIYGMMSPTAPLKNRQLIWHLYSAQAYGIFHG